MLWWRPKRLATATTLTTRGEDERGQRQRRQPLPLAAKRQTSTCAPRESI